VEWDISKNHIELPAGMVAIGRAARWLTRRPTVMQWSRLLPGQIRMRVRRLVNDLSRQGVFYDLPVRLDFPEAAKEPGPLFRVVVFGAFFSEWNRALVDRAMWQAIPGVIEVIRVVRKSQIAKLPSTRAETLIVPLGEDHIRDCPTDHRSLVPAAHALETLSDKARFADFMEQIGLAGLCPRRYPRREDAAFPCVLKRLDQNGAYGVELVASDGQLDALLRSDVFVGQRYLLQAFVPGDVEYSFHAVCRDGAILWSIALSRSIGPGARIGSPDHDTVKPITPSPHVLSQISTVLARLHYSGPCCANYKVLPSGDIAIFEINPRFGGSLMIASNRTALRQALICVLENAR
jgi:hypothetical protein